ncbi:LysM peptidoglycan-binding domain-containing protein [Cryobacterium fucosi]|nr:LysM peptidoglycan-binding domain-containing protein [Cryobacterium fucosi]
MSSAMGMTAIGSNGALGLGVADMASDMAPVRTRLHLTRRGRVVFTTLAAIPLAAVALALALNGGIAAAEGTHVGAGVADAATVFDYVTIQSGQSLWQLAETIAPTSDPRDVIAGIVSLNQLPSESVQPGQRLALPARF